MRLSTSWGSPAPVLQHAFYDSDGFIGRTDFFWPEYGVIGEFDGDAKYLDDDLLGDRTAREAVLAEKKREDRLRALGYTVVRWDWKAVTKPELLGQKLAAAGLPAQKSPPRGLNPLALAGEWTTRRGILGSARKPEPRGPGGLPGRRGTSAGRRGR